MTPQDVASAVDGIELCPNSVPGLLKYHLLRSMIAALHAVADGGRYLGYQAASGGGLLGFDTRFLPI